VTARSVAAVTGASGYLGSRISAVLEAEDWRVARLVRSPGVDAWACIYDLGAPISPDVRRLLESTDVVVHAAYDLSLTSASDIWRVNVEGTRRLLDAASEARVRRVIVLSSMSAFEGTTQLYGRAKLAIEALTERHGGCAVRPGLVYGEHPGGMAGALRRLTTLPIVPLIAGDPRIYTVRESDLMSTIAALAAADVVPAGVISVAHPVPVRLRDLMVALAALEGRECHFVKIPWKPIFGVLRLAEYVGLHPRFRADSLLGLVHSAPRPVNGDMVTGLGVTPRAFGIPPG
jgi:nucleoside-diphosphate-sugar epimerase